MQRIVIPILTILIIGLALYYNSSDEPVETIAPVSDTVNVASAGPSSNTKIENVSAEEETEVAADTVRTLSDMSYKELQHMLQTDSIDCTSSDSLLYDEDIYAYQIFSRERLSMSYDELKPYGDYTESQLIELTTNGDSLAMYALGINYHWFATNQSFNSPEIQYQPTYPRQVSQNKYDDEAITKSVHWFFKAAVNGHITALSNITRILKDRISANNKLLDSTNEDLDRDAIKQEILKDKVRRIAIYELINVTLSIVQGSEESLQKALKEIGPEAITLYEEIYDDYFTQWKLDREKVGLPINIYEQYDKEQLALGNIKIRIKVSCNRKLEKLNP